MEIFKTIALYLFGIQPNKALYLHGIFYIVTVIPTALAIKIATLKYPLPTEPQEMGNLITMNSLTFSLIGVAATLGLIVARFHSTAQQAEALSITSDKVLFEELVENYNEIVSLLIIYKPGVRESSLYEKSAMFYLNKSGRLNLNRIFDIANLLHNSDILKGKLNTETYREIIKLKDFNLAKIFIYYLTGGSVEDPKKIEALNENFYLNMFRQYSGRI